MDERQTHNAVQGGNGELHYGGARLSVEGRALRLMLWLANHQGRINAVASESGQLWLTWKGDGNQSISGDVKMKI